MKIAAALGGWNFPTTVLGNDLPSIVNGTYTWILGFMGIFAVGAIVYSGIMYITSGGDSTQAENAKKNLTWAIIGTVIISLSMVIVNFVQTVVK
jgi:hypothetical protein